MVDGSRTKLVNLVSAVPQNSVWTRYCYYFVPLVNLGALFHIGE